MINMPMHLIDAKKFQNWLAAHGAKRDTCAAIWAQYRMAAGNNDSVSLPFHTGNAAGFVVNLIVN